MDVVSIIGLVTGAIGSCGTAVSIWLAVERYRDRKPRIKVILSSGSARLTSGNAPTVRVILLDNRPGNPPPHDLILTALNVGRQTVTLGTMGFHLPNGFSLFLDTEPASYQLPHALAPGERCDAWPSAAGVARDVLGAELQGTVRLIGFYSDQLGNTYLSKPLYLNVNKWAKEKG